MTETELDELLDKEVTLYGIAMDAKGGAVLMHQGNPIYIEGLDFWPDELFKKKLNVTGTLVLIKLIPDPTISEDGAISQGAEGMQYVLKDAKWEEY